MANIIRRREENQRGRELARQGGGAMGWDPFRMMSDLLQWDPFRAAGLGRLSSEFVPEFDIQETQDSYVFTADLPGVREEELEIDLSQNLLTVSGRRQSEETRENERYFLSERAYGEFRRTFALPEGADPESARADLKDGVLRVQVKKRPEVQPRRISLGQATGSKQQPKA